MPPRCLSLLACGLAACGRVDDGSGDDGTTGTDGWILKSPEEIEAQFPCEEDSQHVGELQLRSLADIEALAGVREVVGTLHITGDASDLRPLHCLRTISEDLRIYDAAGLRDLAGLEGLTTVEGAIQVGIHCDGDQDHCSGNRDLETVVLPGLETARRVTVGVSCGGEGGPYCGPNSSLVSVEMNRLEEISDIFVSANPVLAETKFESATELVRLFIHGSALHTLSLPRLRRVEDLTLGSAHALEEVVADDLETTGNVEIQSTGLSDLSFLSARSAAQFTLNWNPQLTSLRGLERLQEVDQLFMTGNAAMTTLEGLEGLRAVHGRLLITDMSALESLKGLDALETVERFTLEANEVLPDLTGLTSLTNVPWLSISNNPSLASLEGMDALESVGELSLRSNAVLASVEGARTLEVRERFDLYEAPMLRA